MSSSCERRQRCVSQAE
ncbi:hypothetical protein Hamer_G002464 [Homarus americanus]|uniref:Uncharacterized protein n=1 Tax=Homarus americanus TaxID=6706 RepID=A0A8J5K394_HOMAM|nr:hypothetical protein Hamer_G002464 [Homarus americanus]